MRNGAKAASAVFMATVAVTAAAVADPIVERLSNSGLFGPGQFTDRSNLDVLPALVIGAVLAVAFVLLAARRLLADSVYAPAWLRDCAEQHARPSRRNLATVYSLQLVVLFTMETFEQIAISGHAMGPTLWLGAPILIALFLHLTSCLAFSWLLGRALTWSARTLAQVVRAAVAWLRLRVDAGPVSYRSSALQKLVVPREPHRLRVRGRAPPFLAIVST